jgi:hypothetical protein
MIFKKIYNKHYQHYKMDFFKKKIDFFLKKSQTNAPKINESNKIKKEIKKNYES